MILACVSSTERGTRILSACVCSKRRLYRPDLIFLHLLGLSINPVSFDGENRPLPNSPALLDAQWWKTLDISIENTQNLDASLDDNTPYMAANVGD